MNGLTRDERVRLYVRLLLRGILFIAFVLFFVYVVPPAIPLFAPFIAAFIMAFILNPLVHFLHKKLHVPRRLLSFLIVVLVFFGLAGLAAWFIQSFVGEAVSLAKNIQVVWDNTTATLNVLREKLTWLLDFLPGDTETMLTDILDSILLWLQAVSRKLADYVMTNAMTITTSVSRGVMTTVIFIMSAYFMTADYPRLRALAERFTHNRAGSHIRNIKSAAMSALGGYVRAQLLLALFAFVVMFAALALYGQQYALLIAFILAVIDFLPFIGTAIMLVPWGILNLLSGDMRKGIFLLVLAASFFLARRFAEPKIVGQQTGLPPLLALVGIYLGMKLGGVWGMILGPVVMMVLISVIKSGLFDSTIKDIKAAAKDIGSILRREM